MKIYFYPKFEYKNVDSPNPYIHDFEMALAKHNTIVNKTNIKIGIFELFKYFFAADVFIYHWIEDLPIKKFGKIQTLVFIIFLYLAKIWKKKQVFVLHNKYSHSLKKNSWIDLTFDLMMKHGDLILTHSEQGVVFGEEKYPQYANKIKYIIHPIKKPFETNNSPKKEYDLLLWGSIYPYKGTVEFLRYLKSTSAFSSYKIVILGRVFGEQYKKELDDCLTENIHFQDKFFTLEEIAAFAQRSKFILFTHRAISVLSSGSLMDSLRMGTTILGPDHGAFKDLSAYSFVETYNSFEEIPQKLKNYSPSDQTRLEEIQKFCEENTWELFADKFQKELKNTSSRSWSFSTSN